MKYEQLAYRKHIHVRGIVQGVGFRPFIYRIAKQHNLTGYVENNSSGVDIEVEGDIEHIEAFERDLTDLSPPLSHIVKVTSHEACCGEDSAFEIRESDHKGSKTALIPPDCDVCPDCLNELFDPNDRRYRYPFINCTNCGPRFTIIKSIPYDRPFTTMKDFQMCPDCLKEYENPADRRFHAQPVACHVCGPQLSLMDESFNVIDTKNNALAKAIDLLATGKIVAIKGIGGYHLAVDADKNNAVMRLRRKKLRDEKPFALMCSSLDGAKLYADISESEAELLKSRSRPIVLVQKLMKNMPSGVAPFNKKLGIMLPYTPLSYLLMADGNFNALVMTSANISDDPIVHTEKDARERLAGIADAFLVHDRPIYNRADDSIELSMSHGPVVLRRSRGYAPIPIMLDREYPTTLAVGGELKNTFCVIKEDRAYISPHIGDLKYEKSYDYFCFSMERYFDMLDVRDFSVVAFDKHPDYSCSQWARDSFPESKRVEVQHHHAHLVSVLAERGALDEEVIGVIFDGTGYGDDGSIWGGEFFVGNAGGYERMGYTSAVPLPGGDVAVKEPWRIAVGILHELYGDNIPKLSVRWMNEVTTEKLKTIKIMVEKKLNTTYSHGVGRLFDAAAALTGLRGKVSFEGQAAMELETVATTGIKETYPVNIVKVDDKFIFDIYPVFKKLVEDSLKNVPIGIMSAMFHNTIAEGACQMIKRISGQTGLRSVALSGGVFQNRYLSDKLGVMLESEGLQVFRHSRVPPNDGGISLGQAVAGARKAISKER